MEVTSHVISWGTICDHCHWSKPDHCAYISPLQRFLPETPYISPEMLGYGHGPAWNDSGRSLDIQIPTPSRERNESISHLTEKFGKSSTQKLPHWEKDMFYFPGGYTEYTDCLVIFFCWEIVFFLSTQKIPQNTRVFGCLTMNSWASLPCLEQSHSDAIHSKKVLQGLDLRILVELKQLQNL